MITFSYGGDIWTVPKDGGIASKLSSAKGNETFPRFSPDGAKIAFSGNYDGNVDVYVLPLKGGVPTRVTHHGMGDRILDWYPDGQNELVRQFYGQWNKEGLVVDERFNNGGQIPDRFIELLNRKPLAYWSVRDGENWQWPPITKNN